VDDGFVHWDRSGQQQKTGAHRKDSKAERQQPRTSDTRVPIVHCAVAQRLGFHDFPPIERKVIQGQTGALASSMSGPMQAAECVSRAGAPTRRGRPRAALMNGDLTPGWVTTGSNEDAAIEMNSRARRMDSERG